MEESELPGQAILKGKIVINPQYHEQLISEYVGNPCIEALPNIFDDSYVVRKLTYYPAITEKERESDVNVRYHLLKRIKDYYQPMDVHLKIEHTLSCNLRRSYIARNPVSKEYLMRLRLIIEVLENEKNSKGPSDTFDVCNELINKFSTIPETQRSTAECFSIIGVSGMGKSTAIEKLLQLYPQVIVHRQYKGKPLTRTQITWLKIDCPYDGSIKTFCKMFFKALDDVLLTTNYFRRYGNSRNSAATMMIHMTHLASLHSIGLLVIDEMQHLINPKNKPDDILNFLVTLTNMIGISIIQIGTPKVTNILTKGLREARRAEESGCIFWDRMKEDEEWQFFLESLWEYQVLRKYTPMTDELEEAMYYETQGITAIAINLFILVQAQAMFGEVEEITPELIHEVAKNDLRLTNKAVKTIRSGNIGEIANYEDIVIEVDTALENKMQNKQYLEKLKEVSSKYKEDILNNKRNLKDQITTELMSIGLFNYLDYKGLEAITEKTVVGELSNENISVIKKKVILEAMQEEERLAKTKTIIKKSVNKESYNKKDLRLIFKKATKEKIHVYELLKQNGYIKDPLNELY